MSADSPSREEFSPPMSTFSGPVGELIGGRLLSPPSRPGLLATLERYEILRILGGGGMGIVFLARDTDTARDVAIKMVKPELASDAQIVRRFLKEAGHMQKLRHPGIVEVLRVSESEHGAYFVMPYLEEGNLSRWIRPGASMDKELALCVGLQVAEGLQFAHRHGIIHRDLKPTNVLLGAGSRACLADFGLARSFFNDSIIDAGDQQCEGTAPYMSPAVAAGQAEDTRCDIYAFGALLYEMLTGEPPFKGRSTHEIRTKIIAGPPNPIRKLNPKAAADLVEVAEGAMAPELRDRYANMADVVADLQRIAGKKSPVGPRGKLAATPKAFFVMAILAASVITTSGVGLLWRRHHAHVAVAKTVSALPWKASPLPIPTALRFESVRGISADPQGSVYVADSEDYTVYRVTPDGHRTMLVGSPRSPGTADGGSTTARFSILWGIAADQSGNVFVSDGSRIRKITPKWATETLAGLAGTPGEVDGASRKARFDRPSGVAADSQGNVYVADAYTIRKVTPGGATSTLAGKPGHAGSLDGVGGEALFSDQAKGLAVNSAGNVFVADSLNCTIRKITPDGVVSTIAGSAGRPGSVDGPGRKARFFRPGGLAVDASGRVYVADTYNQTIRMVTPDGVASTIAGSPGQPGNQDGPAAQARFRFPGPVAVDAAGDVFVGDTGNHTIRKISPAGLVTTLTAQE